MAACAVERNKLKNELQQHRGRRIRVQCANTALAAPSASSWQAFCAWGLGSFFLMRKRFRLFGRYDYFYFIIYGIDNMVVTYPDAPKVISFSF